MIFGGNLFLGAGMVGLGAAALVLPAGMLLLALRALCAAFSAIGGPMQDITVATLRQTSAAACRPRGGGAGLHGHEQSRACWSRCCSRRTLFDAIGVAQTVIACGVAALLVVRGRMGAAAENADGT